MYTLGLIEAHTGLHLSLLFRKVFLSEFYTSDTGRVGEKPDYTFVLEQQAQQQQQRQQGEAATPAKSGHVFHIINVIARWYSNFFHSDLKLANILYSHTLQAFIHAPPSNGWGYTNGPSIDAELYTNHVELRALVTLIGPYGVRTIDQHILANTHRHVQQIVKLLDKMRKHCSSLSESFTNIDKWKDTRQKMLNEMSDKTGHGTVMDALCMWTIQMGTALKFRELLHQAQRSIAKEQLPVLYDVVDLAQHYVHSDGGSDKGLASFDNLALDLGMELVEEQDAPLMHAIASALPQGETVELFPILYAMMFISEKWWKDASYNVEYDGHDNNVHCIVYALKSIFAAAASLQPNPAYVKPLIAKYYLEFINLSCYSIQHLHNLLVKGDSTCTNTQNMMVFLEYFVSASNGRLTLMQLEEFFPYTILRANYIDLYRKGDVRAVQVIDDGAPAEKKEGEGEGESAPA